MDDLISYVCLQLNITAAQIAAYRVYADSVAVVVDYGINGSKKYTLPLPVDDVAPAPEEQGVADYDATDAARQYAASHNIDLGAITGTGARGRITLADVKGV